MAIQSGPVPYDGVAYYMSMSPVDIWGVSKKLAHITCQSAHSVSLLDLNPSCYDVRQIKKPVYPALIS